MWMQKIRELIATRDYEMDPHITLVNQKLGHISQKDLGGNTYRDINTIDRIVDLGNECKSLREEITLVQNEIELEKKKNSEYEAIIKDLEEQIARKASESANLELRYDKLKVDLQSFILEVNRNEINNEKFFREFQVIETQYRKLVERVENQAKENKRIEEDIRKLTEKRARRSYNGASSFSSSSEMVVPMDIPRSVVKTMETDAELYSVSFSSSGATFVLAGCRDSIDFYDSKFVCRYKLKGKLSNQFSEARCVRFSSDDRCVLACTLDNSTHVWSYDAQGGFRESQILTRKGITTGLHLCALFYGTNTIVTGSENMEIRVWDIQRGICVGTLPCGSVPLSMVIIEEMLYSGHLDGTVKVWDMRNYTANTKFNCRVQSRGIASLMSVPSKEHEFIVGTKNSSMKLVDIRSCKELVTYSHTDYENTSLWAKSSLSMNGEWVFSGSNNGDIFVWEKCSGDFITRIAGHKSIVRSFSWSNPLNFRKCSLITCDKLGRLIAWK